MRVRVSIKVRGRVRVRIRVRVRVMVRKGGNIYLYIPPICGKSRYFGISFCKSQSHSKPRRVWKILYGRVVTKTMIVTGKKIERNRFDHH